MRQAILIYLVLVSRILAESRLYLLASGGEAPYRPISDVGGSIGLYQTGIAIDYHTRFLTPYSKTTLGYYNHGIFAEQYVGLQLGVETYLVKPSITLGAGIQSSNEKEFTFGDDYRTKRATYTPYGYGLRVDALQRIYGEWDWRVNGYPWWKLEIGYRLL